MLCLVYGCLSVKTEALNEIVDYGISLSLQTAFIGMDAISRYR